MTHVVVTRWYRSPELLFGAKSYGVSRTLTADIWNSEWSHTRLGWISGQWVASWQSSCSVFLSWLATQISISCQRSSRSPSVGINLWTFCVVGFYIATLLVLRHWVLRMKRAGLASPPSLTLFSSNTSRAHLSGRYLHIFQIWSQTCNWSVEFNTCIDRLFMLVYFPGTFSQLQETTCWTWWEVSVHCVPLRDATLRQHSSIVPQRLQSHLKYLFDWPGLPTSQTSQPHHLEPACPSPPTSSRPRKIRWSLDHTWYCLLSLMDQEKPSMKRKFMEGASNQISKKLVF